MTTTPNSPAEKLIADFYGSNLLAFFPSAVDGTPCVEVREFSRLRTATVVDLARSIMRYKKSLLK